MQVMDARIRQAYAPPQCETYPIREGETLCTSSFPGIGDFDPILW